MSRTLTAMGDSTATSGLQPWLGSGQMQRSPPRGPYISVITNRLAPPLPNPGSVSTTTTRDVKLPPSAFPGHALNVEPKLKRSA